MNPPADHVARTEAILVRLVPKARAPLRAMIARVNETLPAGVWVTAISGLRTYAEQTVLYAQGRTKPGRVVTNARGGYSLHNFGVAVDLGVFVVRAGKVVYLDDSPHYDTAGRISRGLGLEWGGDWKSIVDKPHHQIRTGKTLAQLRADVAAGRPVI